MTLPSAPAELARRRSPSPASTSATSTVSQPTSSSYETGPGTLLPRTPNGARDSTSVGAEPRLPGDRDQADQANDRTQRRSTAAMTPAETDPEAETNAP